MSTPLQIKLFSLLLFASVVSAFGQTDLSLQERSSKAREYFINGTTLQLQGNRHAEAILEFQQSLKYDSASVTMTAIGRSFLELRKVDRAEEYVRRSLELDPKSRDSWELLAEILISSGRYDDGVAAYEKVRTLSPTKRQLYTLGRLYEPRDAKKAIEVFEQICAKEPDVGVLRRLAALYERTRNADGALRSLERAIAVDPDNTEVAEDLVDAFVHSGRLEEARQLCRQWTEQPRLHEESVRLWLVLLDGLATDSLVSQLYPESVGSILDEIRLFHPKVFPLLSMGGGVALSIGDVQRADSLFAGAAALSIGIAEPLLQIGGLYITFGYPAEGIAFLLQHQPKHASDPRFLLLIADGYLNLQEMDRALQHYLAALELDPSIVEAWLQVAMLYDSKGMLDSSDVTYEHILKLDPRNMMACNNYAYSLAVRGLDMERARDLSWIAVQQNQTNAAYLDTYAWVLFNSGELELARKYMEKAVELGGNSTHLEHLGDILERLGDLDGAVRAWELALEKDSERTYLRNKIDQYR